MDGGGVEINHWSCMTWTSEPGNMQEALEWAQAHDCAVAKAERERRDAERAKQPKGPPSLLEQIYADTLFPPMPKLRFDSYFTKE